MNTTRYSERTLAKIAKLDGEVASLKARLDAKLNERRLLLASLIANGETLRTDVSDQVRTMTQANNLATTGRVLTDEQVREIRRLYKSGVSQGELGRRYGIAQPSVHKIVHRRSYQDVA